MKNELIFHEFIFSPLGLKWRLKSIIHIYKKIYPILLGGPHSTHWKKGNPLPTLEASGPPPSVITGLSVLLLHWVRTWASVHWSCEWSLTSPRSLCMPHPTPPGSSSSPSPSTSLDLLCSGPLVCLSTVMFLLGDIDHYTSKKTKQIQQITIILSIYTMSPICRLFIEWTAWKECMIKYRTYKSCFYWINYHRLLFHG